MPLPILQTLARSLTHLVPALKPPAAFLHVDHFSGAKSTDGVGPAFARTSPAQLSDRDEWQAQDGSLAQNLFALPSTSHCYERWPRFSTDAPFHDDALLHLPCVGAAVQQTLFIDPSRPDAMSVELLVNYRSDWVFASFASVPLLNTYSICSHLFYQPKCSRIQPDCFIKKKIQRAP